MLAVGRYPRGLPRKRGLLTRADPDTTGGVYRETALAVFREEKQFACGNCSDIQHVASPWSRLG